MKRAFTVLEPAENRDDDGRLILGDPTKGCRHCGDIGIKVAENDQLVLYHPGVECCARAVADQLRFRRGDIDELQKEITAKEKALELIRDEARMYDSQSKATEATKAYHRLEHSERTYDKSLALIQERLTDLAQDITRLNILYGDLGGA